jgi:hypothetical protein
MILTKETHYDHQKVLKDVRIKSELKKYAKSFLGREETYDLRIFALTHENTKGKWQC